MKTFQELDARCWLLPAPVIAQPARAFCETISSDAPGQQHSHSRKSLLPGMTSSTIG
ncbi:rCG36777 [Rattus norvegicus]|uniref:RCG36777 n=1 Tax=Rattus norvegicus TaxID=10116 RepID=A6JS56_RAT|nr:rCG36777 [Rattus norvegicus]